MKKSEKTVKDERPVYILCPRCEINYIDKRDKYCAVCKAEMGIGDPSILLPDEEEEQGDRLCPVCHVNLLGEDEEIPDGMQEILIDEEEEEEEDDFDDIETVSDEPDDFDYNVDPSDFEQDEEDEDEDL